MSFEEKRFRLSRKAKKIALFGINRLSSFQCKEQNKQHLQRVTYYKNCRLRHLIEIKPVTFEKNDFEYRRKVIKCKSLKISAYPGFKQQKPKICFKTYKQKAFDSGLMEEIQTVVRKSHLIAFFCNLDLSVRCKKNITGHCYYVIVLE